MSWECPGCGRRQELLPPDNPKTHAKRCPFYREEMEKLARVMNDWHKYMLEEEAKSHASD